MTRMHVSMYTFLIIAVLSTEISGCFRSSNSPTKTCPSEGKTTPSEGETTPTLPRLRYQPEIESVTTSSIRIAWKKDYDGDGPICGYIVNLKSPSSISWSSVGFVPSNEVQYTIERLDAKTWYSISVAILHCSGGQGEMSSELRQATAEYTSPPSLLEAPQTTSLTSSSVALRWTSQHQGDRPICGYIIHIRVNGDEEQWLSVGLVPVDGDLEYEIDHLEANTAYQVAVSLISCSSAREGPLEPVVEFRTLPLTLPALSEAPQITNQTSSSVTVHWTNEHRGEGPICGYVIYIRVNGDEEQWLSVGLVPVDGDLEYGIDHLEANTAYQVAVALINCLSAREGLLEPVVQITTLPLTLPTLPEAPQITSLTSSSVTLSWISQHQGEGPICGYVIYVRVNEDEEPWLIAGYVPVDVVLEYAIDHLEAYTAYQVAVALINCLSAREGPLEPVLQIRTNPIEASQRPPLVQNRTIGCPQHTPMNKHYMYWIYAAPVLILLVLIIVLSFVLYTTCKRLRDSEQKRTNIPGNHCSSSMSAAGKVTIDVHDVPSDAEYEETGQYAITDGKADKEVVFMKHGED